MDLHNEARLELGLDPLKSTYEQYSRADGVLMLTSEHFDFPVRRLPLNVRYVGTPTDDAQLVGTWLPPWPAEDQRPLVLVSFSTLSQGQAPVLARILRAFGGLPLRALVTLGTPLGREDFEAPPNVVLETFVPHSAVLPYVSAVVSKCGVESGRQRRQFNWPIRIWEWSFAGLYPANVANPAKRQT